MPTKGFPVPALNVLEALLLIAICDMLAVIAVEVGALGGTHSVTAEPAGRSIIPHSATAVQ